MFDLHKDFRHQALPHRGNDRIHLLRWLVHSRNYDWLSHLYPPLETVDADV